MNALEHNISSRRFGARNLALWALSLLLALGACGPREVTPGAERSVTVRMLRVRNPDLPSFTNRQVEIFLAEAQRFAANQLGLNLRWIDLGEETIEEFFHQYYPIVFPENRTQDPFVLEIIEPNVVHTRKLAAALLHTHQEDSFDELMAFARAVLPPKQLEAVGSKESLLEQVAHYHLENLAALARLRAPNNPDRLLLNPNLPFHQYVYWDAALERVRRFDFILTNQLLASAEVLDASIHTSLRGGITTGFTERSHATYGGTVMLSSYPVLGAEEPFREMRGGDYGGEEAARLLGAYSAHEFGHLFLHWGHPFDHEACVMNPAKSLRYREWYEAIEETGHTPSCQKPHPATIRDLFFKNRPWHERALNSSLQLWDRLTGN